MAFKYIPSVCSAQHQETYRLRIGGSWGADVAQNGFAANVNLAAYRRWLGGDDGVWPIL